MSEKVQCCYCQHLEIRLDIDDVPFDWCEKVGDSPDPQRIRECEHYEKLVPPDARPFGNGLDVCPVCGKPSTIGIPQTNGDRVRSMTDEKLAEWIVHKTEGNGFDGYEQTVLAWLKWLKEPVKGEQE